MFAIDPITPALAHRSESGTNDEQRAKLAFQEMERLFLNVLLDEMRNTVPEGELFPKSATTRHFEEMLDDILSSQMAASGQLGVSKMLEELYGQSSARITALPAAGQDQNPAPQPLE